MKKTIFLLLLALPTIFLSAQQIPDITYNPEIQNPEYKLGEGPVVFIDEGHYNFHTKEGRYKAFSNLLERDGYVVKPYKGLFENKNLEKGKILVISNALNKINEKNWYVPTPTAFTENEIEVIEDWVKNGGSLFLIADHMPMAGAAKDLASVFGFEFTNGFVFDTISKTPAIFSLQEKTLFESTITKGRNSTEKVKQIATFTGQAFKIPNDATPILIFDKNYVNMLPDTAWIFNKKTPQYSVEGWYQGACKKFGKGRIVAFGEAAMFSAQLAGPNKIKAGMNNEIAPENYKLLLNIIHWLDGKLD